MSDSGGGVGTTALPTSSAGSPVRIYLDTTTTTSPLRNAAAQPHASVLATFEAPPFDDHINGNRIDTNEHFVVYAVKNGLVRILHRHTTMKTILRAHKDQRVTDIRFFDNGDVLATVGSSSTTKTTNNSLISKLMIGRVFEKSTEINMEPLLEIRSTKSIISRVVWHLFNLNRFWMIHTNEQGRIVATMVDSMTLTTQPDPEDNHRVCDYNDFLIAPGLIQVKSTGGDLTDLAWSTRDANHVITSHTSGEVILWDMTNLTPDPTNGSMQPRRLATIMEPYPVTRVLFLPHERLVSPSLTEATSPTTTAECLTTCFATGSRNNSVLTLWSPFTVDGSAPRPAQIMELQDAPSSCLIGAVFGSSPPSAAPPSSFLVMADRTAGNIWAFHCRAEWDESGGQQDEHKRALLVGADYVVPFKTLHPTYSWTLRTASAMDIADEELYAQGGLVFDTKIFAYQSKMVQCLTLTSYMCLPPESTWTDPTPGVRVERVFPEMHSAHVSEVGSDPGDNTDELQYDEEYDIEDEDDADEFEDAPDPASLPAPVLSNGGETAAGTPGLLAGNLNSGNPFSNWLGALGAIGGQAPPPSSSTAIPAAETAVAPPASALPKPTTQPDPISQLLSPSELSSPPPLAPAPASATAPKEVKSKKSSNKGKSSDKKSSTTGTKPSPSEGIKILKRDDAASAPAPAPAPTSTPLPAAKQTNDKEIQQIVRNEIQSFVPELSRQIHAALKPDLLLTIKKASSSSNASSPGGIVDAIDEPLRQAFTHNMKAILVPSMEAVTGQVLQQVSTRLEMMDARKASENKELQSLKGQVEHLSTVVEQLSTAMASLHSLLSQQQQQLQSQNHQQAGLSGTAPPSPPNAAEVKAEIKALLDKKEYEAAFTKAVSATTTDLAVYCCRSADIMVVLGDDQVHLSQPILLCLMQQLGTVIGSLKHPSDLKVEVEWLQEIALSLDPKDARIHTHVARVLDQLDASINARLVQGDPSLKRPLTKLLSILRGIRN